MALTDTRVRTAKPKPKPYKLSDGGGMYLLVMPDGARYWRTIVLLENAARSLSVCIPLYRCRRHAHVAKMRGGRSLRTSIPALQRRRGSELQELPAKTRSRPLGESGLPTSGIGWRRVTARCFSPG
jgi:Arm DNA-binding domain